MKFDLLLGILRTYGVEKQLVVNWLLSFLLSKGPGWETFRWTEILQNSYENPSTQRGP